MYSLVPQIIFFASLAVIVALFIRASSRVTEEEIAHPLPRVSLMSRLIERLPLEEIDAWINAHLEKTLRKTRVFLLKIDNRISTVLEHVKTTSGSDGTHKTVFFGNGNIPEEPKNPSQK